MELCFVTHLDPNANALEEWSRVHDSSATRETNVQECNSVKSMSNPPRRHEEREKKQRTEAVQKNKKKEKEKRDQEEKERKKKGRKHKGRKEEAQSSAKPTKSLHKEYTEQRRLSEPSLRTSSCN